MRNVPILTFCCLLLLVSAAVVVAKNPPATAHHNRQGDAAGSKNKTDADTVREAPVRYNEINVDNGGSISGVVRSLTDKAAPSLKDAVVYIKGMQRGKAFAGSSGDEIPVIDQKDFVFVPHVTVVPVGGAVELRNADPEMHNLHSYSAKNASFNEAIASAGRPVRKKFDFVEAVRIGCDLHQEMSAWIVTRDNPYYYLTAEDGSFVIKDIPPGRYKLALWHEGFSREELAALCTGIDVEPRSEFEVDFYLVHKR